MRFCTLAESAIFTSQQRFNSIATGTVNDQFDDFELCSLCVCAHIYAKFSCVHVHFVGLSIGFST